ncbi:hypothetical protein J6590_082371, partial [Homalodisca vitripennis]
QRAGAVWPLLLNNVEFYARRLGADRRRSPDSENQRASWTYLELLAAMPHCILETSCDQIGRRITGKKFYISSRRKRKN